MSKTKSNRLRDASSALLHGMAQLLDFGGTLQERDLRFREFEDDLRAIRSDWEVVGDNLRRAMRRYP